MRYNINPCPTWTLSFPKFGSLSTPEVFCASLKWYLAAFDRVEFILKTLLDAGLVFVCDEDEPPPLLHLGLNWQLNGLNLKENT